MTTITLISIPVHGVNAVAESITLNYPDADQLIAIRYIS